MPEASMEWSVDEILRKAEAGEFWLPHFQRGGVWTPEMGERLLDSLYLETPCGSIVTWCPKKGKDYGVPITGSAADQPTTYLVDGQQRVRALYSLAAALGASREDRDDEGRVTWVFLANTPEFADAPEFAEQRSEREGVFFRDRDVNEQRDSTRQRTTVRNRHIRGGGGYSISALALLAIAAGASVKEAIDTAQLASSGPDVERRLEGVAKRVARMRKRKFFVSELGTVDFQTALNLDFARGEQVSVSRAARAKPKRG